MADPTIFVVDPDQPSQQVIREIAQAMQINCACYGTARPFHSS